MSYIYQISILFYILHLCIYYNKVDYCQYWRIFIVICLSSFWSKEPRDDRLSNAAPILNNNCKTPDIIKGTVEVYLSMPYITWILLQDQKTNRRINTYINKQILIWDLKNNMQINTYSNKQDPCPGLQN